MENRRRRAPKKGGTIQTLIANLKLSPIAYHAVLIALTVLGIIVLSSIVMRVITRHGTHRTVPEFMGVKIAEAERLAEDTGLEIIINDSLFVPAYEGGIVLDQLPKSGVEVKAGEAIGYVGDTAMVELADEPHLHFELTVAGIQVNPLDYLGEDAVATLAQDNSYEESVTE